MQVAELDYTLPEALIAQHPAPAREDARLLVLARDTGALRDASIRDLAQLLPPALFIFNDTRVLPARLLGQRPSGGRFELLLVERLSAAGERERWLCMGRPLKSLRTGLMLALGPLAIEIGARREEALVEVELSAVGGVAAALEQVGQVPLPPYVARSPAAADRERYQTVFARAPGAVAAPTAGLHFGGEGLRSLADAGHTRAFVTLHVGPGTFAPLAVDDLTQHPMHEEAYSIPTETLNAIEAAKREGRLVVAVGTTVVRALESSAAQPEGLRAGPGRTRLCIHPPYRFRVIDALVTNFHLPRSTLLALVMAFASQEHVRAAYQHAVAARYRFFSYGDAMLIADAERLRGAP
ncbi:MAG TPA: tRNA preQ1(34) S-adenosylmethionine ribosyltransferase-isomerase QueA [Polyangiales bacterium]